MNREIPNGKLDLIFDIRQDGSTYISRQFYKLPMQVLPPHYQDEDGTAFVYMLNPSGGILENDYFEMNFDLKNGANVVLTTPSANKIYKMNSEAALQKTIIRLEKNTVLEYIPEHNIPYANSMFCQETDFFIEKGANLFAWDILSSGRITRGESFDYSYYTANMNFFINDILILREKIKIEPKQFSVRALGVFEDMSILACCYLYSEKLSSNFSDSVFEKLKTFTNLNSGVTLIEPDFMTVKILGNKIADIQEAVVEVWSLARKGILDKKATRIRK